MRSFDNKPDIQDCGGLSTGCVKKCGQNLVRMCSHTYQEGRNRLCGEQRTGVKSRSNNGLREWGKETGLRLSQWLGAGTGVRILTVVFCWAFLSVSPDVGRRLKSYHQSNIETWSQTLHYKYIQTFPNNPQWKDLHSSTLQRLNVSEIYIYI